MNQCYACICMCGRKRRLKKTAVVVNSPQTTLRMKFNEAKLIHKNILKHFSDSKKFNSKNKKF